MRLLKQVACQSIEYTARPYGTSSRYLTSKNSYPELSLIQSLCRSCGLRYSDCKYLALQKFCPLSKLRSDIIPLCSAFEVNQTGVGHLKVASHSQTKVTVSLIKSHYFILPCEFNELNSASN